MAVSTRLLTHTVCASTCHVAGATTLIAYDREAEKMHWRREVSISLMDLIRGSRPPEQVNELIASRDVVAVPLRSQSRDIATSYRSEVRLVGLNPDDTLRVERDDGTVVDSLHRQNLW